MGERMPACHYIAPDFNPDNVSRRTKPRHGQHQVRFMLPFAIQCTTCGDYMFQGTKCNCRKEVCYGEFYLNNPVFRLYMHCKNCFSEITIKTDPKNLDYAVEQGAQRHFEPWRDLQIAAAQENKRKMAGTMIQQVEEKTADTQREMDQMKELERLRATSKKLDKANLDEIIAKGKETSLENQLTEEDQKKIDNFEQEKGKVTVKTPNPFASSGIQSNAFSKKKSLIAYDDDDD